MNKIAAEGEPCSAAARIHIEVDGGITPVTAPTAWPPGGGALVAGTAVFKGGAVDNPEVYGRNIAAIRAAAEAARIQVRRLIRRNG